MINSEVIAWLALRLVYAWMYLYPARSLIGDWAGTVNTTRLLFPRCTPVFAAGSLVLMIVAALMILLGVYGQVAAAALFVFNLGGALVHYRLAAMAGAAQATAAASQADCETIANLASLGWVGHVTSAQKNFVLAVVALFIALMGTGPCSLIDP